MRHLNRWLPCFDCARKLPPCWMNSCAEAHLIMCRATADLVDVHRTHTRALPSDKANGQAWRKQCLSFCAVLSFSCACPCCLGRRSQPDGVSFKRQLLLCFLFCSECAPAVYLSMQPLTTRHRRQTQQGE